MSRRTEPLYELVDNFPSSPAAPSCSIILETASRSGPIACFRMELRFAAANLRILFSIRRPGNISTSRQASLSAITSGLASASTSTSARPFRRNASLPPAVSSQRNSRKKIALSEEIQPGLSRRTFTGLEIVTSWRKDQFIVVNSIYTSYHRTQRSANLDLALNHKYRFPILGSSTFGVHWRSNHALTP